MTSVLSVQVGAVAPLGPQSVASGFIKRAVQGPVDVAHLGLKGDAQADLVLHGGPDKAVYGYAASHYAGWLADFPEHEALLVPGAFGENLTIGGFVEDEICVGDVHRIGSAVLQVCQPRVPCYKFAIRFQDNRMPRALVRSGRSGWYYRVLQAGRIQAGDAIALADRPHPGFPFTRLIDIVNHGRASMEDVRELATMSGLATALRMIAQQLTQDREAAA